MRPPSVDFVLRGDRFDWPFQVALWAASVTALGVAILVDDLCSDVVLVQFRKDHKRNHSGLHKSKGQNQDRQRHRYDDRRKAEQELHDLDIDRFDKPIQQNSGVLIQPVEKPDDGFQRVEYKADDSVERTFFVSQVSGQNERALEQRNGQHRDDRHRKHGDELTHQPADKHQR